MNKKRAFKIFQDAMMVVFSIISLLILIDFRYTKETSIENISKTTHQLENKYSAARNYYYAYFIQTENRVIAISEEFQAKVGQNTQVAIEKSLLFNEINKVTLLDTMEDEVYSFRRATGLFLPCFVLLVLGLGFKIGPRLNTLVFVSEMLLIADFIYLLFN